MLLSFDWLSDYVDLHGTSPETLADVLTMVGLEVDGLEFHGASVDGVIVGHVLATRQHPNADRLTLCDVNLGSGEPVQIVCGAPNVAAGQKVPVATVGTTLSLPSRKDRSLREEVTLSRAEIRGEVSEGMICAEDELGLSEDHAGIMVLEDDVPVGQPFADYLRQRGRVARDATLDVAITPNRPDATSHIGVARDVAAATRRALRVPEVNVRPAGASGAVAVRIEAPSLCPRYVGLIVRGVRVGPSPAWLQQRLRAVGLRPINNVVDATNFVMYEVGQPLHAFDLSRLAGEGSHEAVIVVRQAAGGERFTTLDDQERTLQAGTLLICDAKRPVAVAGVMGGVDSEVTADTSDLLIESAYFDPVSIRQAARALGLQTDSSYRFERGADPAVQAWAASRAAELIREVAGGEIAPTLVDEHPVPVEPRRLLVRASRVAAVLGTAIDRDEIRRLLEAIGFGVSPAGEALEVVVPTFRPDIEREIDVIEEVARLFGYDRIALPGRMVLPSTAPRPDRHRGLRAAARDRLAGLGFHELFTNSLLPAATAEAFAQPVLTGAPVEAVVTANAINRDMAALRPSLAPGVLSAIAYNQNRGAEAVRVFEFGHVFGRADDPGSLVDGYRERQSLLVAISGHAAASGWDTNERPADFFDLKGCVEHLLTALGLTEMDQIAGTEPDALTAYRLFLEADGQRIGVLARTGEEIEQRHDLRQPVFFAEIDWTRLAALLAARPDTRYEPISRHPAVERDLAVTVNRDLPVGPMMNTIRRTGQPLLRNVGVFDLYAGENIAPESKSVAFRMHFQAYRTLTDKAVDRQVRAIVEALERDHGARLRQ
jgi:phenylalanyl-tRNA synthetase beta chain